MNRKDFKELHKFIHSVPLWDQITIEKSTQLCMELFQTTCCHYLYLYDDFQIPPFCPHYHCLVELVYNTWIEKLQKNCINFCLQYHSEIIIEKSTQLCMELYSRQLVVITYIYMVTFRYCHLVHIIIVLLNWSIVLEQKSFQRVA